MYLIVHSVKASKVVLSTKMKHLILSFIFLICCANFLYAQSDGDSISQKKSHAAHSVDSDSQNWSLGVNVVQQFNFPILHSVVAMEISKKNHFLYAGLNYTRLLENYFGDEVMGDLYEENAFGINFGYRHFDETKWQRLSIVLQLDFMVYRTRYKQWGGHGVGVQDKDPVILENSGGIGLNYKVSSKVSVSAGGGLSSPAGFFLMLDQVNPHFWVGLHYRFD